MEKKWERGEKKKKNFELKKKNKRGVGEMSRWLEIDHIQPQQTVPLFTYIYIYIYIYICACNI